MGWMLRVVRHRARAQATILATVTAVTVVGATLLGTFALLLAVNQSRALDVALSRAPTAVSDVAVRLDLAPGAPAQPAVDAGNEYLDGLLDGLPDTRTQWLQSQWLAVQGTQDPVTPLVYLGVVPADVTLVDGAWPSGVDDAGAVPVAVPQAAADRYGWAIGDRIATTGTSVRAETELLVVAVYTADPPRAAWSREVLAGRIHDPSYPYPGTFGFLTTSAWGPLVVDPAVLLDDVVVSTAVRVVSHPDLTHATRSEVDALRVRLSTAQQDATAATAEAAQSADVSTLLDTTIDAATGDLAVTRVSVVLLGLMLVVVAVTVLLLAARLLAERRAPEQTLMSSRGASGGQLLGLAGFEALAVAAVTAALSPWLARLLYSAITRVPALRDAGLHVDPGHPTSLWVTCALGSAVLAAVLVGPLLRRRGSVADAEQQLVRQDRRQALARSGADLAVVAMAGIALWQLTSHGSPVVRGSGQLDPLLVAAPALVLLAGGVIAGRVLPLVAHVGERVAARSRALVAPLAAWEVSRRPGRAAGAALLLTLSIAVGTFAQGYLDTWRTSQRDQAELVIGTDLRAVNGDGTALEQSATLAQETAIDVASPVGRSSVGIGIATGMDGAASTTSTTLLTLDTRHTGDLLRGRAPGETTAGGWEKVTEGLAPSTSTTGVPIPAGTAELRLSLSAQLMLPVDASVAVDLVVQDQHGLRSSLAVPALPVSKGDPEPVQLAVEVPAGVGALQLVAVSTRMAVGMPEDDAFGGTDQREDPRLAIDVTDVSAVGVDGTETPLDMTRAEWHLTAHDKDWSHELPAAREDKDGLHLEGPAPLLFDAVMGFSLTTFVPEPVALAVVTPDILRVLGAKEGTAVVVDVGGAEVQLKIQRVVEYLPGMPRTEGVLVDRDTLTRATWVRGSTATFADEWWARVDDAEAQDTADRLTRADMGAVSTRVQVLSDSTDGPLRVGIQAALWLVIVASAGLAVAGLGMSATVAVRTRRLELARLQALGASRQSLVRAVLVEHALLGTVGVAAGLAVGALLAQVVGPVIAVSATGLPPVPDVVVHWPWPAQLVLVGGTVLVSALVVLAVAQLLLRRTSGALLRLGDEG